MCRERRVADLRVQVFACVCECVGGRAGVCVRVRVRVRVRACARGLRTLLQTSEG
jgi:hypothetical protein